MTRSLARALATVLLLVMLAPMTRAATHQTVPSANFSFMPTLQTFLTDEDANRHADLYPNAVVSGGIHSTAAGLTGSPSALLAYLAGVYTTESGTITYPDNSVCWVIAHTATTGNLGSFVRVSGTHYLINCGSIPQPMLPSLPNVASVYLMKVTTTGGAIIDATDLRPWGGQTGFDACKYVSLNDAMTALGSRPAHLLLNCHLPVTSNVSLPITVSVWPTRNGAFAIESGVTITAVKPSQFPLDVTWQIFEGASTTPIAFTNSGKVRPEWFGGGTAATASAQTTAINRAITAQPVNSDTAWIIFGFGTYLHDNSLVTNSRNVCLRGEGPHSTELQLTTIATSRHAFKVTGTTQFQCAMDLTFAVTTPLTTDSAMDAMRMDGDGDAPGIESASEQIAINIRCIGFNICVYGDGNSSFDIRTQFVSNVYASVGGSGSTSGVNEGVVCQRVLYCVGDILYVVGNAKADHGLYALTPTNVHYTGAYITGTLNEAVKLIPTTGVASLADPLRWTFKDYTLVDNGGSILITADQDYLLEKVDLSGGVIDTDGGSGSSSAAIMISFLNTGQIRNLDLHGITAKNLQKSLINFSGGNSAQINFINATDLAITNWSIASANTHSVFAVNPGTGTLGSIIYSGTFNGNSNGRSVWVPGGRDSFSYVQALAVTESNTSVPEPHYLTLRMNTSTEFAKAGGTIYCQTQDITTGANTTETVLGTKTLAAGALDSSVSGASNTSGLRIHAWGLFAATATVKTVKLYAGSDVIQTNDVTGSPNNLAWDIVAEYRRYTTNAQTAIARMVVGAVNQTTTRSTLTHNLANTLLVKVTGTNGTANANDIHLSGFCIDGLPN